MIKLTEKAELYLKENLLNTFDLAKMLVLIMLFFLALLSLQDFLLDTFNFTFKYEWQHLTLFIIPLFLYYIYFDRIVWHYMKRKNQ